MSAAMSASRGRHGFERRGWWPAVGVLVLMLALWFVPIAVNDAVAEPGARPVDPSATYTVDDENGTAAGTVRPGADWSTTTGTSGDQLLFAAGAVTVSVKAFTDVQDIDRLWDRQARAGEIADPPITMVRHGDYRTPAGLSGPTGTISQGGARGEAFLLARNGSSGTVLSIYLVGRPGGGTGRTGELERFVDTAEVSS